MRRSEVMSQFVGDHPPRAGEESRDEYPLSTYRLSCATAEVYGLTRLDVHLVFVCAQIHSRRCGRSVGSVRPHTAAALISQTDRVRTDHSPLQIYQTVRVLFVVSADRL